MLISLLQFIFMFSHVTGSTSFPTPLSPEDEKKYLLEYEEGSEEARTVLIERNLRLVAYIAKKYNNYQKESEDLISVGTIGLIKGIDTFKSSKGTRLATYVARCIENEILMSIRSSKKYSSDQYLGDPVGMDKDGNEVILQDKIADDKDCIEDQVSLKMQIKTVCNEMKKVLDSRERIVIELRYGLGDGHEKTQREISAMLGISRSYVSRIEKKALKKLFKSMCEYR